MPAPTKRRASRLETDLLAFVWGSGIVPSTLLNARANVFQSLVGKCFHHVQFILHLNIPSIALSGTQGTASKTCSLRHGFATTTTYFVGAHYQVENGVVTKYYYAGSQRIAMRQNGTLSYLLGDHLGSTSLVTDANGNVVSQMYYKAWGEVRYASGNTPTKYQYTGQYSYESDFGLQFYNARWYDSYLNQDHLSFELTRLQTT